MLSKIQRTITTVLISSGTRVKLVRDTDKKYVSEYVNQQLRIKSTKFITIAPYIDYTDNQMRLEASRAGYNWEKAKIILYEQNIESC